MTQFKGTPGPWERGDGNHGGELLVYCDDALGSAICDATSHYNVIDKQTRIANLNLIAAAPELLEALQMALEWIDAVPSDTLLPAMPGFDRDEVNSIINKATGETK